jgi:hypothetical protein
MKENYCKAFVKDKKKGNERRCKNKVDSSEYCHLHREKNKKTRQIRSSPITFLGSRKYLIQKLLYATKNYREKEHIRLALFSLFFSIAFGSIFYLITNIVFFNEKPAFDLAFRARFSGHQSLKSFTKESPHYEQMYNCLIKRPFLSFYPSTKSSFLGKSKMNIDVLTSFFDEYAAFKEDEFQPMKIGYPLLRYDNLTPSEIRTANIGSHSPSRLDRRLFLYAGIFLFEELGLFEKFQKNWNDHSLSETTCNLHELEIITNGRLLKPILIIYYDKDSNTLELLEEDEIELVGKNKILNLRVSSNGNDTRSYRFTINQANKVPIYVRFEGVMSNFSKFDGTEFNFRTHIWSSNRITRTLYEDKNTWGSFDSSIQLPYGFEFKDTPNKGLNILG